MRRSIAALAAVVGHHDRALAAHVRATAPIGGAVDVGDREAHAEVMRVVGRLGHRQRRARARDHVVEERSRREHRVDARTVLVLRDHGRPESQHGARGSDPAARVRRGPGAPPGDEHRAVEQRVVGRLALQRLPHAIPRLPPDLDARNRHGGQRRRGESGLRDVVDADDRELLGHLDADLPETREQAERDEVVERDRGCRPGLEHRVGGVVAGLHAGAGGDREELEVGISRPSSPRPSARCSFA